MQSINEILEIVEAVDTDNQPKNVFIRIEFNEIEDEEWLRQLAKQENQPSNLFEPSPSIPYLWFSWNVRNKLEVIIRCKMKKYVLG